MYCTYVYTYNIYNNRIGLIEQGDYGLLCEVIFKKKYIYIQQSSKNDEA